MLMKVIQDGIKVSIQDGVEEDPEEIEKFIITGKSGLSLAAIITTIMNPKIESEIATTTDSTGLTATITTTIGLVVA